MKSEFFEPYGQTEPGQPHQMERLSEHLGNHGILRRALNPIDDAEPAALAFDPHDLDPVSRGRQLACEDADNKLLGEIDRGRWRAGSVLVPELLPLLLGLHHDLSTINDAARSPLTDRDQRQERENGLAGDKDVVNHPGHANQKRLGDSSSTTLTPGSGGRKTSEYFYRYRRWSARKFDGRNQKCESKPQKSIRGWTVSSSTTKILSSSRARASRPCGLRI